MMYSTTSPPVEPQLILCTAGIHRLAPHQQVAFLKKVSRELSSQGQFIVGEIVLRDDSTEDARRRSALELVTQVLKHAIERQAPRHVLEAAVWVLENDLLQRGEFKRSRKSLCHLLAERFHIRDFEYIWSGSDTAFGDCIVSCVPRRVHQDEKLDEVSLG